jgi:predicted RNase H-like HicB family nuclease
MKFRLTIQRDDDGFYVAEVPALPGCISQGTIPSAALDDVREAIALYPETLNGNPRPSKGRAA